MLVELIKALEKREKNLTSLIKVNKSKDSNAPDGHLRCSMTRNHPRFYLVTQKGDSRGTYIGKKRRSIAAALAQKEYDQKVLYAAKNELSILQTLLNLYKEAQNPESEYKKLNPIRQNLIQPFELTTEQYLSEWTNATYTPKELNSDAAPLYTLKGERVRSKSEIMIADTLNKLDIPYRYEYPLDLFGLGTIHPDFTILNVKYRKEMIWEHFGLMDDEEYAQKAINRINHYIREGYYPGETFIATFETKANPIHSKFIEQIAAHYFLE